LEVIYTRKRLIPHVVDRMMRVNRACLRKENSVINGRFYQLPWLWKNAHLNQGVVTRAGNYSGKSGK